MASLPFVVALIAFLKATKYPLFFLGAYIEGTVVMLTGGVLLKLGQVDFVPLYISLILGDILSDIMWYWVGYLGARRFVMRWGSIVNITPAVVEKLEGRFKKYHLSILIFSKLTMGFGLAVPILVTAGMMRVSFLRYCTINMIGSFVWVAFVIFVGYTFGNVLNLVPEQYQIATTIAALIVFFLGLKYLGTRLGKIDW